MIRRKVPKLKVFLFIFLTWLIIYLLTLSKEKTRVKQEVQIVKPDQIALFSSRIVRPKYDVNCKSIFEMNKKEILKAKHLLNKLKFKHELKNLADENFIIEPSMCSTYKQIRSYNFFDSNDKSVNLHLAYSILTYDNAEQFERLLNLIYRPENIYCIHIDSKSSDTFKKAIRSIADCFDNVFISTRLEYIVYASYSRLQADLNCMRDLLDLDNLINNQKHSNLIGKRSVKWSYFLNMASSEFPLRTNYELTRILNMYNGSNEVEIIKNMNQFRIKISWEVDRDRTKLIPSNKTKSDPPHGYKIVKGYAYCVLFRDFVNYAVNDKKAQDLLEWSKDTWSPDEWFWSTLQYNSNFYSKSGFKDQVDKQRINTIARFAGWGGEYQCKGKWRNGVCVFSIEDLPEMITRPHFIVNKFLIDYDPISYQCMEEWYAERLAWNHTINMFFYCNFLKSHSTSANCPHFDY